MTTTFSKCLSVFVTLAALLFLGFAAVTLVGGPNWSARTEDLADYDFKESEGEKPEWSWTRRSDQQTKKANPPILPAAIAAARADLKSKQDTRIQDLKKQITAAKAKQTEADKLIAEDLAALANREKLLLAERGEIAGKIDAQQQKNTEKIKGTAQTRGTQSVRDEIALRREDVYRLRSQLEEIQTDRYRATRQREKLEDLLTQLQGDIRKLQRRQEQLKKAGAKLDYDTSPKPPASE